MASQRKNKQRQSVQTRKIHIYIYIYETNTRKSYFSSRTGKQRISPGVNSIQIPTTWYKNGGAKTCLRFSEIENRLDNRIGKICT